MKFGVIGLKWGKNYVKNLQSLNQEIVITCSRSNETVDPNLPWTKNWETAVCHPEADTIIIATPPELHYPIARAALSAGKDVICEKPFVSNLEQLESLKYRSRQTGKSILVNYIHTWNPILNKRFSEIPFGELTWISSVGVGNGPYRSYSVLEDWASHDLSILHHLYPEAQVRLDYLSSKTSTDGNNGLYTLRFSLTDGKHGVPFTIRCGNQHTEKARSFSVMRSSGGFVETFSWQDDFQTNSLKVMLQEYIGGKKSNIDLATKVTQTLAQFHAAHI